MLAFAIDNPAPCTIVLITGDRDFSYALSILKLRQYRVVLVTLPNAHPSLRFQAPICFDWFNDVVNQSGAPNSPEVRNSRQPERNRPLEPVFNSGRSSSLDATVIDSTDPDTDEFVDFERYLRNRAKEVPILYQVPSPGRTSPEKRRRYISPSPTKRTQWASLLPPTQQCAPTSSTEPTQGSMQPESLPTPKSKVPIFDSLAMSLLGGNDLPLPQINDGKIVKPAWSIPVGSVDLSNNPSVDAWCHSNRMEETTAPTIQIMNDASSSSKTPLMFTRLGSASDAATEMTLDEDIHTGDTLIKKSENVKVDASPYATPPCIPNDLPELVSPTSVPGNMFFGDVSSTEFSEQMLVVNKPRDILLPTAVTSSTPNPPAERPIIPPKFTVLVQILQSHRSKGRYRPLRSGIAMQIAADRSTYQNAGVDRFGQYMHLAVKAGIVELGGLEGEAWVGLMSQWVNGVPDNTS
jgi:hypothetical protein